MRRSEFGCRVGSAEALGVPPALRRAALDRPQAVVGCSPGCSSSAARATPQTIGSVDGRGAVPSLFRRRGIPHAYTAAVEDRATLTQARSMLILLLATCKQSQTALEAAANAIDTDLTSVLGVMIERTEGELEALQAKIAALPA